jgi:hypothetical protein
LLPPHNRRSLHWRLCNLRRFYTGESDTPLRTTLATGMATLTKEDRATILATLDSGFETRLLGENLLPAVEERIRRVVLPDTTDPVRQQLEAGILFALGRIAPYRWPANTSVDAPMPVCEQVSPVFYDTPDTAQTVLRLRPAAAAPMIATLLPRVIGDTVQGLAGLRVATQRRHVHLHLADSTPSVHVTLANTNLRQWLAMLAFADAATGLDWPHASTDPLTDPERAVVAAGRVPGPVAVASALFRRLRVLGDTLWLTVRAEGPDGIRMEWAGGRTAAQVAAALVHPVAGLRGDLFTAGCGPAGSVIVTAWGAAGEPRTTVVLRQAPAADSPPFTRIDAADAWAEFGRVMALPKHVVSTQLQTHGAMNQQLTSER